MTSKTSVKELKTVQEELRATTRKLWLAGLGVISVFEEESMSLFDQLVARGQEAEAKGRKRWNATRREIESTTEELTDKLDQGVSGVLRRMGVPSRMQVEQLTERVDKLVSQVDRLSASRRKAPSRSKARKPTASRKTKAA